MIQEQKNTKKYLLTVEVDLDALINTYREGDTSIQLYDLPPIEEIIEFEMGFVSASGIHIKHIEEIEENKISIDWNVEDIQGIVSNDYEKSISEEDAVVVLEYLEDNYDPNWGITWTVIQTAIDELSSDNSITLI